MTIDANLLLQGRVPNLGNRLLQGIAVGNQLRQAPLNDQLLQQQTQTNDLNMQIGQQGLDTNAFNLKKAQEQQARIKSAENAIQGLSMVEQGDFAGLAAMAQQELQSDPNDPKTQQVAQFAQRALEGDTQAQQQLAQGFTAGIQQARMMGTIGGGQAKTSQFGSSSTIKDAEGNIYTATEVQDPNTGAVQVAYSPMSPNAPATPQGAIDLVSRSTGLTGQEIVTQAGDIERTKQEQKDVAKRRQESISSGNIARSQRRKVNRMIELLDDVKTGGMRSIAKDVKSFFGFSAANEAELANKFGQLLLGDIKKLGANPTEGERAFIESISASFKQGNAANIGILNDMKRVLDRQIERAQMIANDDNMTVQQAMILQDEFEPTDFGSPQAQNNQPQPQPAQEQPQSAERSAARTRNRGTVGGTTVDPQQIDELLKIYGQ